MDQVSLARHGPLGRFDAPVEAEYRRWLELHLLPLVVALGGTSAIAWLAPPPAAWVFAKDDVDLSVIVAVCWGVNVLGIAAGLTWAWRAEGRYVVALGTLGIGLTAVDSIVFLGPAIGAGSITYLAAGMFYGMLAPVVQSPFRQTVGLGVLVFALSAWPGLAQDDAQWEVPVVAVLVTLGISTLVMGPAMAWASERGLRNSFAAEQTVAQQRNPIRRYAPSTVVSRIEQGDITVDHPQRRKVTVFFSDVVGFTEMADRVELVGGAVAAAAELQRSLPEWSRGWYQHGIVEDALARVGINTGTVSVGTFGSAVRATYTGIGLQTNIAARVQAQAPPGGVLLSNTSWHLVKDVIPCAARGEVMVKGVHFPIELYEPLAEAERTLGR